MVGVNFIPVLEHILTGAAFGKWGKAIIPQREGEREKIYMLREYVDLFRLRLPINPREQTFVQMPPSPVPPLPSSGLRRRRNGGGGGRTSCSFHGCFLSKLVTSS